ncbi:MAG: hypothetical protein IT384_20900 [Deltaproteobacteria bacterium]|nr:hypothetical protein [Deltaproteobacteria bacterium]
MRVEGRLPPSALEAEEQREVASPRAPATPSDSRPSDPSETEPKPEPEPDRPAPSLLDAGRDLIHRWDPAALRRDLVEGIGYAEQFYLVGDRNVGTSLVNTLVSTTADLARGATGVLDLGTETAQGWEQITRAQDGWDYAIGISRILADCGEAAGVVLAAMVTLRLTPKQLAKRQREIQALGRQAAVNTGRKGTTMLRRMADRAGLGVEGGGEHLVVRDAAGKKVTTIPHSLQGSGTARSITRDILEALEKAMSDAEKDKLECWMFSFGLEDDRSTHDRSTHDRWALDR